MTHKLHCPVIYGGLVLNLKRGYLLTSNCCLHLSKGRHTGGDIWNSPHLQVLRDFNRNNTEFHPGCWNCESLESIGEESYRTGSLKKYGIKEDRPGPFRIDIMFDISCNLACRHCGPDLSTFWQKHMKDNGIPIPDTSPRHSASADEMIEYLKTLDLSELREVIFSGGETMMGQNHWRVAEVLTELIPDIKKNVTLQIQTNGTIPLTDRNFEIIEKFHLVKFLISTDGTEDQFEYLRWPANWNQWVENTAHLVKDAPVNVMFNLEETIGIFNLFYQERLNKWARDNFSVNRLGDAIDHCKHIAMGTFALDNMTQEYIDAVKGTPLGDFVKPNQQENPEQIKLMIEEINKYDKLRNQDWTKTFPEVAEFYKRYL